MEKSVFVVRKQDQQIVNIVVISTTNEFGPWTVPEGCELHDIPDNPIVDGEPLKRTGEVGDTWNGTGLYSME